MNSSSNQGLPSRPSSPLSLRTLDSTNRNAVPPTPLNPPSSNSKSSQNQLPDLHQTWTSRNLNQVGFRGKVKHAFVTTKNFILRVKGPLASSGGRVLPLAVLETAPDLIDPRTNKHYISNQITSSIYNIYNFLPRQLVAQFSKLANVYFLAVSTMQMIPSWSTTGSYTTIIPLIVFISISMLREAYDDWHRHRQDKEENNRIAKVARLDPSFANPLYASSTTNLQLPSENDSFNQQSLIAYQEIPWRKLQVGDIVKLSQNDWVPADMILLASSGPAGGIAYIETMALDGETNLKSREPMHQLSENCSIPDKLASFNCKVTTEDPNIDLYNFEGKVTIDDQSYPLNSSHIVYRGSILRNTAWAIGLVVFTGEETKIRMNAIQNPRTKAPRLQQMCNKIIIFMVGVVLFLAVFSTVAASISYHTKGKKMWFLTGLEVGVVPNLMGFIIMFNTLIPLSLYVSMEIVKVCQMLMMQSDIDMYHEATDTPFEAHTSTINEELGQVSYIFSDKTGTLTENEMVFRKLSVGGYSWIHDLDLQMEAQSDRLFHHVKHVEVPHIPIKNDNISGDSDGNHVETDEILRQVAALPRRSTSNAVTGRPSNLRPSGVSIHRNSSVRSQWRSNAAPSKPQTSKSTLELLQYILAHPNSVYSQKVKFFILSMALCHTCVPDIGESHDSNGATQIENLDYQAASPDELALIEAARDLGYIMVDREQQAVTIRTYPNGFSRDFVDEKYQVLSVIEFSSARKRMSIIIKFPDNRICVFCKGADNIILERLRLSNIATEKAVSIHRESSIRKHAEAEAVVARASLSMNPSGSGQGRTSTTNDRRSIVINPRDVLGSLDDYLQLRANPDEDVEEIQHVARKSMQLNVQRKYETETAPAESSLNANNGINIEDRLVLNDNFVIEQTLQHIEEFSTEGLRTLLYSYRFMSADEYAEWDREYSEAKTSLVDRQQKVEKIGEQIEHNLELCGATAIEDKLQEGVPEAIDKLRRAGIKMWMLTGDKRETAINIGYSCRLIKDYSTVIVLRSDEGDVSAQMTSVMSGLEGVAHCVVVVDGATLSDIESDMTLMTLFIELGVKADSVICCRASPSQKAAMVSAIRNKVKKAITLAIGDGANDIAMIQSADVGIGITGREGLQAARSSDYAIAQFRFLLKLLLVHGRWNYVRTCKYILGTFHKEVFFYLTQVIYQRNVMFTGTSLYEQWSLSMFNTLFTSLPVLCIGILEKDLKPSTLIAVPELYGRGRNNEGFDFYLFAGWVAIAAAESVISSFVVYYIYGYNMMKENSIYPLGVLLFTTVVVMCTTKLQLLEMHSKTIVNWAVWMICVGGWFCWNLFMSYVYTKSPSKIYFVSKAIFKHYGQELSWWAVLLVMIVICVLLEIIIQTIRIMVRPTDTDTFQELEHYLPVHRRLQREAYSELVQGWTVGKFKDRPDALRFLSGEDDLDTEGPARASGISRWSTVDSQLHQTNTQDTHRTGVNGLSGTSRSANDTYNMQTLRNLEQKAQPTSKREKIKQKLRFAPQPTTIEDEREIEEILERRQRETDDMA